MHPIAPSAASLRSLPPTWSVTAACRQGRRGDACQAEAISRHHRRADRGVWRARVRQRRRQRARRVFELGRGGALRDRIQLALERTSAEAASPMPCASHRGQSRRRRRRRHEPPWRRRQRGSAARGPCPSRRALRVGGSHAQVRDRLSLMFLDLGEHKVKNIARPIRVYRVPLASEEAVRSPFRGLDPFSFEDADSSSAARTRSLSAWSGCSSSPPPASAFLLIYGSSGSGKSSLLRAGLLPRLVRGALPGIALWRRCLIRPSEAADPLTSLAAGLLREEALPELAREMEPADLATLLREGPERLLPAHPGSADASGRRCRSPRGQVRLVLAVDQMEELFTTVPTRPLARFLSVSSALRPQRRGHLSSARSGPISTRAAAKSRASPRSRTALSSFELLPPGGAEIAQIIREPARAAGLRFEETRASDISTTCSRRPPCPTATPCRSSSSRSHALCDAGREQRLMTSRTTGRLAASKAPSPAGPTTSSMPCRRRSRMRCRR